MKWIGAVVMRHEVHMIVIRDHHRRRQVVARSDVLRCVAVSPLHVHHPTEQNGSIQKLDGVLDGHGVFESDKPIACLFTIPFLRNYNTGQWSRLQEELK